MMPGQNPSRKDGSKAWFVLRFSGINLGTLLRKSVLSNFVPIEDIAGAVKELIQEGKVKHLGFSEAADHPG